MRFCKCLERSDFKYGKRLKKDDVVAFGSVAFSENCGLADDVAAGFLYEALHSLE